VVVGTSVSITPSQVILLPGQTVQFALNGLSTALAWAVNGVDGGLPTTGTITPSGLYTAPAASDATSFEVSVHPQLSTAASAFANVSLFLPNKFTPGTVSTTNNPQVALYSLVVPQNTSVQIAFGTSTNYGLKTWSQPAPAFGGSVNILVAGMRANTTYHMQAVIQTPDGMSIVDTDHVFSTGGLPSLPGIQLSQFAVSTPSGLSPQPGIELLAFTGAQPDAIATDIEGNVIWWYIHSGANGEFVQPVKLLPNGDFLLVIGGNSSSPIPPNTLNVAREIDLAGNTVREISLDTLNSRLAAANFNLVANAIHHDVLPLPNGHWILLINLTKQFTDLPGFPGSTTVLGDALVDVDSNLQPVWVWNSFDHLDVNRHPFQFPDWTHANTIVYSRDDGNLLLSIRHQNWIAKIDYQDGNGAGDILWRLGEGGDFTLQGGTDPTDWFYAQHDPSFITPNTVGTFSLILFDNGDDRQFPAGVTCGTTGAPPCFYSTVPILRVDEFAKVATLEFHYTAPDYSFFGGNAEVLGNNDVEFDEAALSTPIAAAAVFEVTQQSTPQIVWQMNITGNFAYRAFRLPSLYPGVQW
jgi:arylsulfate sulfotransferase